MSWPGTRSVHRTLSAVAPLRTQVAPEDWGRLLGYLIGTSWAIVFGIWTPPSYQGVISLLAVHAWSLLMGAGCVVSLIGALTGRDLKVELSGIYLVLVGSLLYLVAQVGFESQTLAGRIPLLLFIAWHMSMFLPRVLGLEAERRRRHAIARIGL